MSKTVNNPNLASLSTNRNNIRNKAEVLDSKNSLFSYKRDPSEVALIVDTNIRGSQSQSQNEIFSPIRYQFQTLANLPEEYEKNPNIRKILKMYAENQGYGQAERRSFSQQEILKMYSVKERLDSEEKVSTM